MANALPAIPHFVLRSVSHAIFIIQLFQWYGVVEIKVNKAEIL